MSIAKKMMDTLKKDIRPYRTNVANSSYMHLIGLFPLQIVTTKEQHVAALKVIEKLITFINEGNIRDEGIKIYLMTLSELVADYERKNYSTPSVSETDMLAYLMELHGLNQKDLAAEIGGQSIVSKILNGERKLNLRQIKALSDRFKISPEVFIGPISEFEPNKIKNTKNSKPRSKSAKTS
ncbi:MAG: helix-turn-helix domain-containing protein [Oligoflexia bacterium]|nr:helix-turn-helix domain-containing protein [Oligoflexia bacterium]